MEKSSGKNTVIHFNSESGYALVLSIILVVVIFILGSAILFSIASETKTNEVMEQREIASYLAYSGIEHGLAILEATAYNDNPVLPSASFEVFNEGNKIGKYQITQLTKTNLEAVGTYEIGGSPSIIRTTVIQAIIDSNGKVIVKKN
ncbi:MAG TPA: hypothetical protein PK733_07775 [Clostridiales bacterium]|nr:hypothetical protein [Clostridiales bacterium]